MPKKYTKTEDGWTKVEEYQEPEIAIESSELYQNNYYHKFQREQKLKEISETQRIPDINGQMPKLNMSKSPFIDTKSIREEQKNQEELEGQNWEKEANQTAIITIAWIFGIIALLSGAIALMVYLIPSLTWQSIGEYIAFGILQIIYFLWKIFNNLCVMLFEWIFNICGGKW